MIFVNAGDHSNEEKVLKFVKPDVPELATAEYKATGTVDIYDFVGFINGTPQLEVDVKVRTASSKTADSYLISKEKVYRMRNTPDRSFYMIYLFEKDMVVKVFNLRRCDQFLRERVIEFTHKRSGERLKQLVFIVPMSEAIYSKEVFPS